MREFSLLLLFWGEWELEGGQAGWGGHREGSRGGHPWGLGTADTRSGVCVLGGLWPTPSTLAGVSADTGFENTCSVLNVALAAEAMAGSRAGSQGMAPAPLSLRHVMEAGRWDARLSQ